MKAPALDQHQLPVASMLVTTLLGATMLGGCASSNDLRSPSTSATERPDRIGSKPRVQKGVASWYGPKFHGRSTASGEVFDMNRVSAAHRTLPFGTVVHVTNLDNGRELEVRINDRGPFVRGRILDLSRAAAEKLGMIEAGIARVRIEQLRSSSVPSRAAQGLGPGVQVAAFRDRERADRLVRQLSEDFSGASVYSHRGWHRVQFRDLGEPRHAKRLKRDLERAGFSAVLIGTAR